MTTADDRPTTARRAWGIALAWALILGFAALAFVAAQRTPPVGGGSGGGGAVEAMQVRLAIGLRELAHDDDGVELTRTALERSPSGALHAAVLAAETEGPAAAAKVLDERAGPASALTERQRRVRDTLIAMYADAEDGAAPRAAALGPEARDDLLAELRWTGRLALQPEGSQGPERAALLRGARNGALVHFAVIAAAGLAVLGGLAGIALWYLILRRPLLLRYAPEPGAAARYLYGAAATFVALGVMALARDSLFPGMAPFGTVPAILSAAIVTAVVVVFIARSPDPAETRRKLGWTRGAGVLREIGAAAAGTPVHVVCVVGGVIATTVLARLLGRDVESAAHPAVPIVESGSTAVVVGMFLQAAVAAPILEETIFRGFLYHHLRSATAAWGRLVSVAAAASAQALIFAGMHPQGIVGVPALAAIGLGLALLREWRGSLIAPMLVHGAQNATVLGYAVLMSGRTG